MARYLIIGLLFGFFLIFGQTQPQTEPDIPVAEPAQPAQPAVPTISLDWLTSLDEGKAKAAETGKDIVLDFTGSDWCVWCQRLDQEVFTTKPWMETAPNKYILVKLDFPEQKEVPAEIKMRNEAIAREYRIEGFPTICLLDAKGIIYAKTGYQEGGAEKYLEHLAGFEKVKAQRDALLAKAEQGTDQEKLEALGAVLKLMEENKVDFAYAVLKEKMVASDSENKLGYNAKYSNELYSNYMEKSEGASDEEKANLQKLAAPYLENLKKFDAQSALNAEIRYVHIPDIVEKYMKTEKWDEAIKAMEPLAEKKPTGEIGQLFYYLYGAAYFKKESYEKAFELLEKAIEIAPDSPLAPRLRMLVQILKMQAEQKEQEKQEGQQAPEQPKPEGNQAPEQPKPEDQQPK